MAATLLQAAPNVSTMPTWLAYVGLFSLIVSLISILLNVVLALRKESREDGLTTTQRLKKLETAAGLHDANTTLLQRQIEDFTGKLHTELEQHAKETDRRCALLEKEADKVQTLSQDVAVMKRDIERIPMIERKLDEMITLLTKTLAAK
ncbi:hypothetical protein [Hymenobacter ruber]